MRAKILTLSLKNVVDQNSEQLQVISAGLGFKVNMDDFHNQQPLQMLEKEATEFVKNVQWEW